MMSDVLRSDPSTIDTTLKEAVVDALVNIVHGRISGASEFGEVIYGTRPSSLMASGFLLPMRGQEEGDEVTSPIWISSHGLDFQVATNGNGQLHVAPTFAIYVRVLPNEEDLKRDDCRATFRLKSDVAKELNRAIRDELGNKWEEVKGSFRTRSEHPHWLTIKEEVRSRIYTARGIPTDLTRVGYGDEEDPDTADPEAEPGPTSEGVVVGLGTTATVTDQHFEPLRVPHKWLRLSLQLPSLEYSIYASQQERAQQVAAHEKAMHASIAARLRGWLEGDDVKSGGKLWAFRRDEEVRPSQYRNWNKFLEDVRTRGHVAAVPDIEPRWDISVGPDWLDSTRLNVHVALENRSKLPKQRVDETETGFFQARLTVGLPVASHKDLLLERVEPSYRYNRFLAYPAMGFNGGVNSSTSDGAQVVLETTWAPRYTQPRVVPASYQGIECMIRKLADPSSMEGLRPLTKHLRVWLDGLPARIDLRAGLDEGDADALLREKQQFRLDRGKWLEEIEAIEAGIAILEESQKRWERRGPQFDEAAIPFEAWLAMNEAMADVMKARFGRDDIEWRLFQLGFVLSNLSAIATRLDSFRHHYIEKRDDAVTLLYFPTGGGKSEAFFGLLLFALMLDRLRGKQLGVTAMIRYPLRLLTIQQAQRAAKVLAAAELVRRRWQYGGQPFSIGFWVGSGGSPNRLTGKGVSDIPTIDDSPADSRTEERLREHNNKYAVALRAWNKIPRCPFCGANTSLRRFPALGGLLGHVCSDRRCESNDGNYCHLPFYICDDDIYDFAPSVVLGTVDKLALIGHYPTTIRRVLGMFGAAPWRKRSDGRLVVPSASQLREGPDAKGCDKLQPAYADGLQLFRDPFPALLIQDEAHLLDESLGTFAGLFESALDHVFAELANSFGQSIPRSPDGQRRRAKVVAASATVSNPERQMAHLYQRHSPAVQFPHPGPDLYESFYSGPEPCNATQTSRAQDPNVEVRSKQARVYAGFMTNGRPHTATSVAVLSSFHVTITDLFTACASGDPVTFERAQRQLRSHLTDGLLRPFHDACLATATPGDLATLIDLHRVALTYVTNKKGGDQIMAAENEEARKRHNYQGLPLDQFMTRLITGSVDQGEIQNVVSLAQRRPLPGSAFGPIDDELRSVIATSAVSHGVDVDEFNAMFFAGMPPDVAEYIQASSRVGRTHVGLCILVPTPQRRRDRFIVEVFDVYHRFLERMVQPAAIDRWAERALERVLPSFFQSFVCGIEPTRQVLDSPDAEKHRVRPHESISDILASYRKGEQAFLDTLLGFVQRATGLDASFAPEGASFYSGRIDKRIRQLMTRIGERQWEGATLPSFFKNQQDPMWRPMTSLRDVDEAGLIRLAQRDTRGRAQDPDTVAAVMDLIRHGVADVEADPANED